jgi:hypothetical protein
MDGTCENGNELSGLYIKQGGISRMTMIKFAIKTLLCGVS